MRIVITMLMFTFFSSLASARGELEDVVRGIAKAVVVQTAGDALVRATAPTPERVALRRAEGLGTVIVAHDRESGSWGGDEAVGIVQLLLDAVGLEVVSQQGREAVKREMRETDDPAFRQSAPLGTLVPADWMCFVAVRLREGPERRTIVYERGAVVRRATRAIVADVTLKLLDERGIARVATASAASSSQVIGVDLRGWTRGASYDGRTPSNEETAICAAGAKALNQLLPRLPRPTHKVGNFCPECGAGTGERDNFCSACGQRLPKR